MYLHDSDVTFIDGFCGCGGSTDGCERAGARSKLAMNHNERSLATHERNFPHAQHALVDISKENPKKYPHATMAWFSPECTNNSTSKGIPLLGQNQPGLWTDREEDPFVERSRATMWDVVRWAAAKKEQGHPFQVLFVENVPKVTLWGGYQSWLREMINLGYDYKTLYFNSQFAPAHPCPPVPQSRDRWYTVFWLKGNTAPDLDFRPLAYCRQCGEEVEAIQCWKNPARQRGEYRRQYVYGCPRCTREVIPYYEPALSAIDWTLPAPRIGDRAAQGRRELKPKTVRRIEMGLERYCREQDLTPFLVETCRTGDDGAFVRPVTDPCFTQTQAQSMGVAIPFIVDLSRSHAVNFRAYPITGPLPTQTTNRDKAVILPPGAVPFLIKFYGTSTAQPLTDPLSTVESVNHHGMVLPPSALATFLREYQSRFAPGSGGMDATGQPERENDGLYAAAPGAGIPAVEDCGFRMLTLREVKRAMGFREDYIIVCTSAKEGVRQCGLAVTPAVSAELMRRALESLGYRSGVENAWRSPRVGR
jgi:DNA (cytosine-5)-methyltransferase 1